MFSGKCKNKWGFLVEYVTGKASHTEIIKNIIEERNHHKFKSLEECTIQKPKKICKKKLRLNKLSKYSGNLAESEAFKTMSCSPLKSFHDPRKSKNTNETRNQVDLHKRNFMSKSPEDMNSLTIDEGNKKNARHIQLV